MADSRQWIGSRARTVGPMTTETTTPIGSAVFTVLASPVGDLTITGDRDGRVTGIWFDDGPVDPGPDRTAGLERDDVALAAAVTQLREYFAGDRTEFDLPLATSGTSFQQAVWTQLATIPYGETRSYGELAAAVGAPGSARAVGLANGSNPIPIVVPCHRVIGANGSLTGYGGGMDRKRILLDLESGISPML